MATHNDGLVAIAHWMPKAGDEWRYCWCDGISCDDPKAHAEALTEQQAYRIGGGRRGPGWAHRWHVDFFFRSWQSENPDLCRFARRGWSAGMAEWLMRRDANAARAGRRTLYQRWRAWRARKWDAKHLTQQKTATEA